MTMTIGEKLLWIFVAYIMIIPWIISGVYFATHWDSRTMLYLIFPSLLTVLGILSVGLALTLKLDELPSEKEST